MPARLHHERIARSDTAPSRWLLLTHGIYGAGSNWRGIARKVNERRPETAEGSHRTLAVFNGAGVAAGDGDGRPPVQVLGDDRQWGDGAEPDDAAELVGRLGGEVPVPTQKVIRDIDRPENGHGHQGRAERK